MGIALAVPAVMGAAATSGKLTGTVYTADEYGNSISRIDPATGEVETVPVSISPHNVQITADGRRLLAVGDPAADGDAHGHGGGGHGTDEGIGKLLVFDTARLASGPTDEIEVGGHLAHVVADRDGRYAFVTNANDDAVAVVDLATGSVMRRSRPAVIRMGCA